MGSLCCISEYFFKEEKYMTVKKEPIKKRINFNQNHFIFPNKKGKKKYLTDFTPMEFCDEISKIFKIRIPFFDNTPLQTISNISYLTGNGPYHEGLIFLSKTFNFYIAQSYPITFVKVKNFTQGISDIISFNNFNNNSHSYKIPEMFFPTLPITIIDIYEIINKLPNKYHILTENCQNFVNNIIETLKEKFKILTEKEPLKIEENLKNIYIKSIKIKKTNKRDKDITQSHAIPAYVDEDCIYLCNIFEAKNINTLKNSQSDGNLFGKYKKLDNNASMRNIKHKRINEDSFNLKY